jgi:NitT/TauT family transport system substrate-binding protein
MRLLAPLALTVALMITACGGASQSAAPASAAAKPAQLTKILVANPSAAAPGAILQVIKDAGIFEKNGLDVELRLVQGAPQLLASLLSGEITIAMQGSPAVMQAQISGADIVMFAGTINTTFFTIFSRPELSSIQDLKGKKVGATPGGGNDEATVNLVLARSGMSPKDVQLVNIPQPARLQALKDGAVDAVSVTLPFTSEGRKMGLKELIDVGSLNLDYQSSAFVTSTATMKDRRDVIVRFTRALSEGTKFYKTNKEASMKSIGTFTKQDDPAILEETWREFALKFTSKVPTLTLPGLRFILENSIDDPKARTHKVEDFVDLSVINQLESEGLYKQLWGSDTSGV